MQTPFWGLFKSRHGWSLIRARAKIGEKSFDFSVLTRAFCKGLFSLAYLPLFPSAEFLAAFQGGTSREEGGQDGTDGGADSAPESGGTGALSPQDFCAALSALSRAIKPLLPKNCAFVRFDPEADFSSPEARDEFVRAALFAAKRGGLKIKKSAVDIQPPDTTLVGLSRPEEEILAGMKSKWRYNVKLAQKKGVVIERAPRNVLNLSDFVDIFYDLYKVTSERDGIAMHSKEYYQDLLALSVQEEQKGSDVPRANLYIARHEGEPLAAIMTLFSRGGAVYLYGCSSNNKRNLMPNFLLQWTAMQDAKAYGSPFYDLYGMPPADDPGHPMHGLYLFKTGFGGRNVHRAGSFDVPLKAVCGPLSFAESARAFWHKKILKKIRGR